MHKATIKRAREYVFDLVGYNGHVSLGVLIKDSCSEISRLLGQWLYKKFPKAKIYIYQGKVKGRFHDLILMQEKKVYVIDPTIWQFFKNKKSILIATEDSIEGAVAALEKYYGGEWKLSECVTDYSAAEIRKFKKVIRQNKVL
jgi:hypothetical protein